MRLHALNQSPKTVKVYRNIIYIKSNKTAPLKNSELLFTAELQHLHLSSLIISSKIIIYVLYLFINKINEMGQEAPRGKPDII